METLQSLQALLPNGRSYRTYEEWKLHKECQQSSSFQQFLPYLWGMETCFTICHLPHLPLGSYRTYEEWKLLGIDVLVQFQACSYRTYEEWKLQFQADSTILVHWFLPYLWGMETVLFSLHILGQKASFLPYLWGMETAKGWRIC